MARKKAPKIKLPRKIEKGQVIEVQVYQKYPSTTGLGLIGDSDDFYRKEPPVFLKEMKATFEGEEVGTFLMTSAISPNPKITFPLKVEKAGTLKIVFQSNLGETFESSKKIKI